MKRTVIKRMKVLGGMMYIHVAYTVYVLVGGIFERKRGKERERSQTRRGSVEKAIFHALCISMLYRRGERERESDAEVKRLEREREREKRTESER